MTTENQQQIHTLVFIGSGNMAEALLGGILEAGLCSPNRVTVTDVVADRRNALQQRFGVQASDDNRTAVSDADVVVLAVKPQVMAAVLEEIKDTTAERTLIVSIAAGVSTAMIEAGLGGACRVVRAMPNTPCLVRSGASAIAGGRNATGEDLDRVERLLAAAGLVVRVREDAMDAVTALSGSGPAYFFYMLEALMQAADDMGLPRETALPLALGTMEGSARLARESGLAPEQLRHQVTSKGGTTEAALGVLNERRVGEALRQAVLAAQRRSRELAGS